MPNLGNSKKRMVVATIIDTHNYGTVLQAIATREILRGYGEPIFADYCRPEYTNIGWARVRLKTEGNPLVNILRLVTSIPARFRCKRVFRGLISRELPLCSAAPLLTGEGLDSDAIYITGSDQTWNSVYNCGVSRLYTLANVPGGYRKVALSASFGRESISDGELDEMAPLLRSYDAVSVRERSGVDILARMGIAGCALKDPVLLCRPSLWDGLAARADGKKGEYVLVYQLNRDARLVEYARKVAHERGLAVRLITFNQLRPVPRHVEPEYLPEVETWLSLFRGASYVVTDSFHGICFSLIFERQFTAFDPPRFSVRISDLLADFGLPDREVKAYTPIHSISVHDRPIDWELIRRMKRRARLEAQEFLDRCLL